MYFTTFLFDEFDGHLSVIQKANVTT